MKCFSVTIAVMLLLGATAFGQCHTASFSAGVNYSYVPTNAARFGAPTGGGCGAVTNAVTFTAPVDDGGCYTTTNTVALPTFTYVNPAFGAGVNYGYNNAFRGFGNGRHYATREIVIVDQNRGGGFRSAGRFAAGNGGGGRNFQLGLFNSSSGNGNGGRNFQLGVVNSNRGGGGGRNIQIGLINRSN